MKMNFVDSAPRIGWVTSIRDTTYLTGCAGFAE
jgi:hypothetical protein